MNTNGGSRHWLSSILYLQQYHHHHHSAFAFATIVSNASLDRAWNSSSTAVHEWSYIRKKLKSSYGFCTWAKIIIPCYIAAAAKYYLAAISYDFWNNSRSITKVKLYSELIVSNHKKLFILFKMYDDVHRFFLSEILKMALRSIHISYKFRMLPFLPISIHHSAKHDTYLAIEPYHSYTTE